MMMNEDGAEMISKIIMNEKCPDSLFALLRVALQEDDFEDAHRAYDAIVVRRLKELDPDLVADLDRIVGDTRFSWA